MLRHESLKVAEKRWWGEGRGLEVRDASHVRHPRQVYGTFLITFHLQHNTSTGSLRFLQVHGDFPFTLYIMIKGLTIMLGAYLAFE
jgi:hypothetical protein